jgi:hypothetical protein
MGRAGQADPYACPTAAETGDARLDTTAAGLDESLGDRQAEARAPGHLFGCVNPVESIEYPIQFGCGKAAPFVSDLDHAQTILPPQRDRDAAAIGTVEDGILQHVEQD